MQEMPGVARWVARAYGRNTNEAQHSIELRQSSSTFRFVGRVRLRRRVRRYRNRPIDDAAGHRDGGARYRDGMQPDPSEPARDATDVWVSYSPLQPGKTRTYTLSTVASLVRETDSTSISDRTISYNVHRKKRFGRIRYRHIQGRCGYRIYGLRCCRSIAREIGKGSAVTCRYKMAGSTFGFAYRGHGPRIAWAVWRS